MCITVGDIEDQMYFFNHLSCYVTEECTGIRCDDLTHPLSMYVTPCDVPPSLQFNLTANGHTQIIFATGNQTTSLRYVDATLEITMWHFDYSMDVKVSTELD